MSPGLARVRVVSVSDALDSARLQDWRLCERPSGGAWFAGREEGMELGGGGGGPGVWVDGEERVDEVGEEVVVVQVEAVREGRALREE